MASAWEVSFSEETFSGSPFVALECCFLLPGEVRLELVPFFVFRHRDGVSRWLSVTYWSDGLRSKTRQSDWRMKFASVSVFSKSNSMAVVPFVDIYIYMLIYMLIYI